MALTRQFVILTGKFATLTRQFAMLTGRFMALTRRFVLLTEQSVVLTRRFAALTGQSVALGCQLAALTCQCAMLTGRFAALTGKFVASLGESAEFIAVRVGMVALRTACALRRGLHSRAMRIFPLLLAVLSSAFSALSVAAEKPNIVFILADDLGIGDVKAFNSEGKIATPHMDRLAAFGMKFTDAHTSSAVCTPTRYGLLTGRYNWRTKLQSGVLGGLSPRLIEEGRLTVAQLLKDNGYATACVGKWHLGMDWAKHEGKTVEALNVEKPNQVWSVDFAKPIANGPNAVGFDYYFGIAASLDMVPYTFIENDHVTKVPTKETAFPMMTDRENGGMTRKGPAAEGFEATDVLPTLAGVASGWIGTQAKQKRPFFLYLPLNAPHTPINPLPEWKGKSGLNAYGDFVMQVDAAVGTVLASLDAAGVAKDTVVILTSDNGCSPSAKFDELRGKGHDPSAGFRGHKADIFEGGHRVPFIVAWPGTVKPGTGSTDIVCLTDFMATAAEIVGAKIPANAAEDSVSFLPALLGKDGPKRTALVSHSINGSFAIREGSMKLCLCAGSGGWSDPKPGSAAEKALPQDQLYDLAADRAETKNLAAEKPDEVKRLTALLDKFVAEGRSTPGAPQKNAVEIHVRKEPKAQKKK